MELILKKILFLIIILSCIITNQLKSQVEIADKYGNKYLGFVKTDEPNYYTIIDINTIEQAVDKSQIINNQPLYLSIIIKNGKTYKVRIGEIHASRVQFIDSSLNSLNISIDNIVTIMLNGQTISKSNFVSILNQLSFNKGYSAAGLTIFSPGGINALYSYDFENNMGIRLSIGYLPTYLKGLQIDGLYNILKTKTVDSHLSLGLGYSIKVENDNVENPETIDGVEIEKKWAYLAPAIDVNFGGFFISAGISIGQGDFTNPQFILCLGFVSRFCN